eukprot:m51a1_g4891 hypothetical protein (558) ;mRNA; r:114973-117012
MRTAPAALALVALAACAASCGALRVPVAALHFGPRERDLQGNAARLEAMCRAAAQAGARLAVTTEMALTGYSFWSRAEVAPLAQHLDRRSAVLNSFSRVALETHMDILLGLPVAERSTGLYRNTAVLLLSSGALGGRYAKMNHLLESSYNAESFPLSQPMQTSSGFRAATVICADSMYPLVARAAALSGADVLLVPINAWADPAMYQALALENDIPVVVANRYGRTLDPTPFAESFDQETFVLNGWGAADFAGAESLIIARDGTILARTSAPNDTVVVATVDIAVGRRTLPAVRRPELYALIAHGTMYPSGAATSYSGLPAPATFSAGAVRVPAQQCGQVSGSVYAAVNQTVARASGSLRLLVLPAGVYARTCAEAENQRVLGLIGDLAVELGVDISVTIGDTTVLRTYNGTSFAYTRTHRRPTEDAGSVALGSRLVVVNRPYARVALLHDVDFMVPEVLQVLSRMAVDVVAVAANDTSRLLELTGSRAHSAMMHVVVANSRGMQGVYHGDWVAYPSQLEDENAVVTTFSSSAVRNKFSVIPHNFDASVLLLRRTAA